MMIHVYELEFLTDYPLVIPFDNKDIGRDNS